MPAFVPIIIAGANAIRMVAPTVARALTKSGLAKEASKKAVDSMKGYIPKATKKEVENLARTTPKGKTLTSAPRPKPNTGAGRKPSKKPNAAAAARGAGNAAARAKKDKDKTDQKNIAERMAQEKIAKNLNKRNLPTTTNKPLATTGGRNVTTSGGRSLTGAARRKALRERQRENNKVVGVSKEGARSASRASQIGPTGLASLDTKKKEDKKLKPVPEVNVRTLPKPKKVRSAPKKGDNEELNINPKRQKPKRQKPTDDGYRFYGKEGTGLGDFSRKYGIKYATPEQFEKDIGEPAKKGGQIKKLSKTKKVVKKKSASKKSTSKRRKGFSGRGAGAALRGF